MKTKKLLSIVAFFLSVLSVQNTHSAEISVLDSNGNPVSDVVVYIRSDSKTTSSTTSAATMDQANGRFEPHILVVSKGTEVTFPNSDIVAHHVYSFSRPNHFVLPLYKGNIPPPKVFEHEGVATIGCNVHDNMLAYIVVVDTPLFTKTNSQGQAVIPTPAAHNPTKEIEVMIWSPRIRSNNGYKTVTTRIDKPTTINLKDKLRSPHRPGISTSKYY